jgi:hypothetical protein
LAKANGFDFYVTSDHSQEAGFQPFTPTNPFLGRIETAGGLGV